MKKNSAISIRIDPESKQRTKKELDDLELANTQAVKKPNAATRKAIDDIAKGRNIKIFENTDDLFVDLES